ncbi:MAG: peptidyl-tRNA hydrolase [Candidatus Saccharibacteria bacterium]|nr:peptidyl-tRNA hydrolase [Candidatus Saccharibacteria bacterium]
MKLIFAQGNPGDQYTHTRHNVGFQVIDDFAAKQKVTFGSKPKFLADIAELTNGGEKVLLVKPTTLYNETGRSARALVDFYKLDPATDILVIHDDLALPFGTLRTREKGSDAGNNGIKSLNAHIDHNYARLRIGIYNDLRERMDDADFVLSRFSKDEQTTLSDTIIPRCEEIVALFLGDELTLTSYTHTA